MTSDLPRHGERDVLFEVSRWNRTAGYSKISSASDEDGTARVWCLRYKLTSLVITSETSRTCE
jgi:hypothetical protein